MKKNLIRVLFILVIAAMIVFYIYDILVNHTAPTKHLFRTLSVICICIAGLLRTGVSRNRRSLEFYEATYADVIRDAFSWNALWRKKLLCAARLFDESNYRKAVKYLMDLKEKCQSGGDHYAVNVFLGLCFTDMQMYEQAERVYRQLIVSELATSRVYSNLGHVYSNTGDYKKALQNYEAALDMDRDNAYAYNNIAQAHFRMHEFEAAIPYAEKALEIKPKLHQASSLLAIIYALGNDQVLAEKYFHIAISSGRKPEDLKEAIEYFRTAQHAAEETGAGSEV